MIILPEQRPHELRHGMVAKIGRKIPNAKLRVMPCWCRIRLWLQARDKLPIPRIKLLELFSCKIFDRIRRKDGIAALH